MPVVGRPIGATVKKVVKKEEDHLHDRTGYGGAPGMAMPVVVPRQVGPRPGQCRIGGAQPAQESTILARKAGASKPSVVPPPPPKKTQAYPWLPAGASKPTVVPPPKKAQAHYPLPHECVFWAQLKEGPCLFLVHHGDKMEDSEKAVFSGWNNYHTGADNIECEPDHATVRDSDPGLQEVDAKWHSKGYFLFQCRANGIRAFGLGSNIKKRKMAAKLSIVVAAALEAGGRTEGDPLLLEQAKQAKEDMDRATAATSSS